MRKPDIKKGWETFVYWKGWKVTAAACKKAWHATLHWSFWKILFGVPFSLVLLLCTVCAVGLVWVFAKGMETQLAAYFLYPLSAYSLLALCVKVPAAIRSAKDWLSRHPKLTSLLKIRNFILSWGCILNNSSTLPTASSRLFPA